MSTQAIILMVAVFFLLVLLAGIIIGWLLNALSNVPPRPLGPQPPPLRIPDTFDEPSLSSAIAVRLAGAPANGAPPTAGPGDAPVVWVDAGDEVLVHLSSAAVKILERMVLISVDLETDQTGRTPLVVALAVSGAGEPAGLVATTDERPRGNALLAARWGRALQAAVWASLLGLARDHAAERAAGPLSISAAAGTLKLGAGNPLQAAGRTPA